MLHLAIYDQISGGRMVKDLAGLASKVVFATGEHGHADLTCVVPATLTEAFRVYDQAGMPYARLTWNGYTVWAGRLEDVAVIAGGLRLKALGHWRALSDIPYTAVWSNAKYADWRAATIDDVSGTAAQGMYQIDNNNRLFIGLTNNATYAATDRGRMVIDVPDGGERNLEQIVFDYDVDLPASWSAALVAYNAGWLNAVTLWSVTSSGAAVTGSNSTIDFSATPRDFIALVVTPAAGAYAGETGAKYAKLTRVRVLATDSAALYADEIAKALVDAVHAVNADQLLSTHALIESPGIDLTDQIYLDKFPADILTTLSGLGDDRSPVGLWETGVYDRALYFRPRGSAGRRWHTRIESIDLERTIESLINSAYAVYQDRNNRAVRSEIHTSAESVAETGLTRRRSVPVTTTSAVQADIQREAILANGVNPQPRVDVTIGRITDDSGQVWPKWMVRNGDTITIDNLSPVLSRAIDRVRTFLVSETRYTADTDALDVTPELLAPSAAAMLAGRALSPAGDGIPTAAQQRPSGATSQRGIVVANDVLFTVGSSEISGSGRIKA